MEMEEGVVRPPRPEISNGFSDPFLRKEGETVGLGQSVGLRGLPGFLFHRFLGAVITTWVSAPLSPRHALVWDPLPPLRPPLAAAQRGTDHQELWEGGCRGKSGLAYVPARLFAPGRAAVCQLRLPRAALLFAPLQLPAFP